MHLVSCSLKYLLRTGWNFISLLKYSSRASKRHQISIKVASCKKYNKKRIPENPERICKD
jgi:hypothetical protein